MSRVCLVPRWGGSADDDWYPWIRRQLSTHEVLVAPLRPSPGAPTIAACVASIARAAGRDPGELERTVFVGHSVGAQAVLRFLETLGTGSRVRGVLCVAGWFWVDDPWDSIQPWIDTPLRRDRVREASSNRIDVLLSDDDPYTRDHDANAHRWRTALGAEVTLVPGAGHLNRAREPGVLETLQRLLGDA